MEFSILDENDMEGNIDALLPSRSRLIRPAVANVDQALVVFSMTDPAPNLNLLDRFLIVMQRQHVPVIICFSKSDLGNTEMEEELRRTYEPSGSRVCFISTSAGQDDGACRTLGCGKVFAHQLSPAGGRDGSRGAE